MPHLTHEMIGNGGSAPEEAAPAARARDESSARQGAQWAVVGASSSVTGLREAPTASRGPRLRAAASPGRPTGRQ